MNGKRKLKSKYLKPKFSQSKSELKPRKHISKKYITAFSFLSIFLFIAASSNRPQKIDESTQAFPLCSKISLRLQTRMADPSMAGKHLKIWVYFPDKGISSQAEMKKGLYEARQNLKERCLWRRSKVRKEENLVDLCDLPLFSPYRERVKPLVKKIRTESRWLNALSAEATPSQILSLAARGFVSKIDLVLSFQRKDLIATHKRALTSSDENQSFLNYGPSYFQLNQVDVLPLHRLGYSGKGVLVCMMDTGFRKSHDIFKQAHIVDERDFVNNDNNVQQDPLDPNDYSDSHGTGTWSILGGYAPGQLVGPAYGADFLLAKTETTLFEQPIEEDYWVAGLEWAESLGAEVVSSSLGYIDWYTFEDMNGRVAVTTIAANRAASLGVVVVNAAGNERDNPWGHIIAPADGFDVISAGAVDSNGQIASFSSPGPTYDGRIKPEVCALGVDNWLADSSEGRDDSYDTGSGTSFATPLVAGVVALILEIHRDWTPTQVRSALLQTASRAQNPDNDYGWGIVDAATAAKIESALPKLLSYSMDDDRVGQSSGNGNGRVEPGEVIEISPTLSNQGLSPALSLEGHLASTHPEITILNAVVTFPLIAPSAEQSSTEPFVVKIPAAFLGHHLVFRLTVQGPNSLTLYETLRIQVAR